MALNLKDNDNGSFGRVLNDPPKPAVTGTSYGSGNNVGSTESTELPTGGSLTQNGGPVSNFLDDVQNFFEDHFGGYAENVYENVVGGGENIVSNVQSSIDNFKPLASNAGFSAQGNADEPKANVILPSAQEKTSFPFWILAVIPFLLLIKKK